MRTLFSFRTPIGIRARLLLATLSVVLLIAAWWAVSAWGGFSEAFFPTPLAVLQAGVDMVQNQAFMKDLGASAARIGVAFAASAVLGVPLALLMSSFKAVESLTEWLIDFTRYVPVPALLPLFVLWGGIGETPKFLVLFFGTFFQLVLLVKDDADNVPLAYMEQARTLGAGGLQLIRDVLIPSMMPLIYDRLRVTLGWCWTYLVIAELVAVHQGVGHVIKEAQRFNAADQLFVCFIALGLIGLLTDQLAKLGHRFLFPHVEKSANGMTGRS